MVTNHSIWHTTVLKYEHSVCCLLFNSTSGSVKLSLSNTVSFVPVSFFQPEARCHTSQSLSLLGIHSNHDRQWAALWNWKGTSVACNILLIYCMLLTHTQKCNSTVFLCCIHNTRHTVNHGMYITCTWWRMKPFRFFCFLPWTEQKTSKAIKKFSPSSCQCIW